MKEIAFNTLGIQPNIKVNTIDFNDMMVIEVCDYLPISEKTRLLQFVVNGALDETTGTFSPLRTEVYFAIAICRWYAGITFTEEDLVNVSEVYDALETNGLINAIMDAIPSEEMEFISSLVEETTRDIARYNSSAAGIIQSMSSDASGLEAQINKILGEIKNGEGLEQLAVIKDVVGKD